MPNNFYPIGNVLNPSGGSRFVGALGARYVRAVQGVACIGGNYMVPTYTRDDGYGGMTALYRPIGHYDIDADTELMAAQTAYSDGEGNGLGIDTAAGPVTRWYALGLIDDTINPGSDEAVVLSGRAQEFLYGSLKEVTITENAALQKVTLTLDAGYVIPADSGANKVAVWALVTNEEGASAYYLGAVEPGGSVIDSYDTRLLLALEPYSPSTFVNPTTTVALSTYGDSFVYVDPRMDAWYTGILEATVTSVVGSETTKVRLRNLAGTGPAEDAPNMIPGVLEWPEWVVGQQFRREGDDRTYLVASLETSLAGDDSGYRTILVLDETTPLASAMTAGAFRIVCPNTVQIGHPDVVAQDKVPAAWKIDLSPFLGDDPVVGAMASTTMTELLCFSTTRVLAITNIPTQVPVTGVMGATIDTQPLTDEGGVPFDNGACNQGCLFYGPNRMLCGFAVGRGPWIMEGRTVTWLDPELKLKEYYDRIAGAEDYPRCKGAYDARMRIAVWTFPTLDVMFVYDFDGGGLMLWQIGDYAINSVCSLIQTAGDGTDGGEAGATEIGTYFLWGLEGGDLVDMMGTAFCDFYRINYDYKFTIATMGAGGELIVTGTNFNPFMRGCTMRIVDVSASASSSAKDLFCDTLAGITAEMTSVTLNSPGAGQTTFTVGTWSNGQAPSASFPGPGQILAICPIDAKWESGKIQSGGKFMQLSRLDDVDASLPESETGWGVMFTVFASGNLSDPYAGAETKTYLPAARVRNGMVQPLNSGTGGKSVALGVRMWQPYTERIELESVTFIPEGAEIR